MSEGEKRRRKQSSQSSGNSSGKNQLHSRRAELLQEMEIGEKGDVLSVRKQLERLKVPTSAAGSNDEDDWGRKEKRKKGSFWILWAVLGLVIPIVLVVLMLIANQAQKSAVGDDGGSLALNFDILSGAVEVEPQDWFIKNSSAGFVRGLEILEALSQDDLTFEQVVPLVRTPQQAATVMEKVTAGQWVGFKTNQPTAIQWGIGASGNTGFLTGQGVRKDFRNFRAYFVRDGEELRLDVAATETLSQKAIERLAEEPLEGVVRLRCWIAKEPHFDARSDGDVYSWYQIIAPNEVDFVWAYVRKGDPLDDTLRKELNYGRVFGDRKKQFRGTITLSSAPEFRADEFLFEELLASEWVVPDS